MRLLNQGELLQDRYLIERLLGSGGFGAVYLAHDQRLARRVAIKEMNVASLDPDERRIAAEMFEREALMLAQLDHPGLTRIWDYFQQGERAFLVMEYVPGVTLRDLLQAGPLPEAFALECALQLCAVLAYLHARRPPVIFRDLKPANVMVEAAGRDKPDIIAAPPAELTFKLIDFGIARIFKPDQAGDTLIVGTPGYAPPEQYGQGQTDARSDIYSLGATLYHMLSGSVPNALPLPSLSRVAPNVAPELARVVERATALDPAQRYPTIERMRDDLIAAANARIVMRAPAVRRAPATPLASPPTPPPVARELPRAPSRADPAPRRSSSMPLLLLVAVVVGVVALGLVAARALTRQGPQSGGGPQPDATVAARPTGGPAQAEWLLPDATGRIAFGQANASGGYDVRVATLDGRPPQRITTDGASISPAWSSDGARLAITRALDPGGDSRAIFVRNGDGDFTQASPDGLYARYSAWSPDGGQLAFAAGPGKNGPFRLAILDLASGAVSYPGPEGVAWITWSRRGPLAYSGGAGPGQPQDVFVMDPSGSSRDLTNTPDMEEDFPSWSPNGRQIAYVASPAGSQNLGQRQIYVINADGGGRRQITSAPGPHTNPVWSPDGQWIAYLSKAAGGDWQVWAMRSDGSDARQITFGPEQKFYLAWGVGDS